MDLKKGPLVHHWIKETTPLLFSSYDINSYARGKIGFYAF